MSENKPSDQQNTPTQGSMQPSQALTRLLLGAVLETAQVLFSHLRQWEHALEDQKSPDQASAEQEAVVTAQQAAQDFDPLPEQLPPAAGSSFLSQTATQRASPGLADSLVGFVFEGADRWLVVRGKLRARRRSAEQRLVRAWRPIARPVGHLPGSGSLQAGFERLVERGEAQVQRWAQRGAQETAHSRQLARQAVAASSQVLVHSLTENPEVQELVQTQSMGLAAELVEEVRERAVSADTLVEGVVRSLLRRTPRRELPPPPPQVRALAERIHPPEKKS